MVTSCSRSFLCNGNFHVTIEKGIYSKLHIKTVLGECIQSFDPGPTHLKNSKVKMVTAIPMRERTAPTIVRTCSAV